MSPPLTTGSPLGLNGVAASVGVEDVGELLCSTPSSKPSIKTRAVDPQSFSADPAVFLNADPGPAVFLNVDTDPAAFLMRIRIQL